MAISVATKLARERFLKVEHNEWLKKRSVRIFKEIKAKGMYDWYNQWLFEECNVPPRVYEQLSADERRVWWRLSSIDYWTMKKRGIERRKRIDELTNERGKAFVSGVPQRITRNERYFCRDFHRIYWTERE